MIVKKGDRKERGPMKIDEYKINSDFSAALIEIDGDHGKIKCINEDRVYFIVEGEGKFVINDEENVVSKEDVIFIPKNTPYNIVGKMKWFMICSPEFNPKDDVVL
ncbi:cupin domain-containing protein [Candidatus Aenigmatarchaeota archaeon]